MPDSHPTRPRLLEAACLAHTVPGVTLRLRCGSGAELLVSYACLGADIDPCRLRATLVHERLHGIDRLSATVTRVDLVAGLTPVGAGLYQRRGDTDERWFVSPLDPAEIADVLATGPDGFHTVIKPDHELGVHAVCLRPAAHCAAAVAPAELDEAAVWALGAVLAGELAAELRARPVHGHAPRDLPHRRRGDRA